MSETKDERETNIKWINKENNVRSEMGSKDFNLILRNKHGKGKNLFLSWPCT